MDEIDEKTYMDDQSGSDVLAELWKLRRNNVFTNLTIQVSRIL